MGDDFVVLNIKTYISSVQQEVYDPKLESIAVTGWIPDYGDPQNYLSQETINNDNAFYTNLVSNVNDLEENDVTKPVLDMYNEFTNMVAEADAVTDLDERYAAYAKAEAYMLDHAMNIPIYHDIGWVLTKINPYSKMNAVYGIQNWKMKNWETIPTDTPRLTLPRMLPLTQVPNRLKKTDGNAVCFLVINDIFS